jgi:hypothetical protein
MFALVFGLWLWLWFWAEPRGHFCRPQLAVPRKGVQTTKPAIATTLGGKRQMVTVAPMTIPPINRGSSLREYEAQKAKRQYLE